CVTDSGATNRGRSSPHSSRRLLHSQELEHVAAHDLLDCRQRVEIRDFLDPFEWFGQPLWVRIVRSEENVLRCHDVNERLKGVLPEWVDVDVAEKDLARMLYKGFGHLS